MQAPLRIAKSVALTYLIIAILFPTFYAPLIAAVDSTKLSAPTGTIKAEILPGDLTVRAYDTDNDAGGSITVEWSDLGPKKLSNVKGFEIWRSNLASARVDSLGFVPLGTRSYEDRSTSDDSSYVYSVATLVDGNKIMSAPTSPARSSKQWFDKRLTWVLIIGILICGSVILFIETAKRGKKLFLRRIAGLEAIDEAVGRATEMGRPILFIPGTQDMNDVQTLAGLTILGRVAKTIAEYDTRIHMPTQASLVMTAGREIIKEAYTVAGRPDAYSDDMVHYVTDEQFGYVAAVNGIMVRERPATCFFMGAFFAESLIMAETGNSIGAIQIAGTAQPAQLPFFVAACDYTLIGEELFAASAYLSGEPKQLGSLKGQDVGKGIAMVAILAGALATTLAVAWNWDSWRWLADLLRQVFSSNWG
jgi:hypothetical protein